MAAMQAKLDKMEMRQTYRNFWHTDLLKATAEDPPFCCFSMVCGPCASYMLRKRALYNDMSRYTCCGGFMPCSGHCGESHCPELCLCTEVFLCFANSVASTRFMIQDEFNIQTTRCDNCIIGFMLCLQQLACIFSIIACIVGSEEIEEASQLLNCLADMVYCVYFDIYFIPVHALAHSPLNHILRLFPFTRSMSLEQTQHKAELDKRDGMFGPALAMAVPPIQQMSRMDQPLPPSVGYPPPPPYGYSSSPGHVYPPMPGYPTPVQGYPPPSYPLPAPANPTPQYPSK